jgi:hypothetical protein
MYISNIQYIVINITPPSVPFAGTINDPRFDLIKYLLHLTIQNKTLKLTDLEMEEEAGIKEVINGPEDKRINEEIFTKVVRAGKRTYFFDVKATRMDDYYLTITESKKRLGKEGKVFYEKHKIFLYKEDFEKFTEGLKDAVTYIDNGIERSPSSRPASDAETVDDKSAIAAGEFTNIEFEDLGKK